MDNLLTVVNIPMVRITRRSPALIVLTINYLLIDYHLRGTLQFKCLSTKKFVKGVLFGQLLGHKKYGHHYDHGHPFITITAGGLPGSRFPITGGGGFPGVIGGGFPGIIGGGGFPGVIGGGQIIAPPVAVATPMSFGLPVAANGFAINPFGIGNGFGTGFGSSPFSINPFGINGGVPVNGFGLGQVPNANIFIGPG